MADEPTVKLNANEGHWSADSTNQYGLVPQEPLGTRPRSCGSTRSSCKPRPGKGRTSGIRNQPSSEAASVELPLKFDEKLV